MFACAIGPILKLCIYDAYSTTTIGVFDMFNGNDDLTH